MRQLQHQYFDESGLLLLRLEERQDIKGSPPATRQVAKNATISI
jgi:hypothetical protein